MSAETRKPVSLAELLKMSTGIANVANVDPGLIPINADFLHERVRNERCPIGWVTIHFDSMIHGRVYEAVELYKPGHDFEAVDIGPILNRAAMTGGYFEDTRPIVEKIVSAAFDAPNLDPAEWHTIAFDLSGADIYGGDPPRDKVDNDRLNDASEKHRR